jgi:hypothetical protein
MKKNDKNVVVLEPSTNTHSLHSENETEVKDLGNGILKLKVKGKGIITHGEHGTVVTENENIIKYVQQEQNPLTRAFQNAFD